MTNTLNIQELIRNPQGGVYFAGIGGIGMSALARYFKSKGVRVCGYDKTETALTKALAAEGMQVTYTDDVSALPKDVQLVVYTPAIPASHTGLQWYQSNNYLVLKRSDVLGAISAASFNICIGGTHGKTTVSAITAHILRHSGYGCNAFLGGIATNYNSNFWSSDNNVSVIEADEYDRSFLKLSPDIAVITATDADHLDIYKTEAALQEAFVQFGERVKKGGLLLTKFGLKAAGNIKVSRRLRYSATNDAADAFAANLKTEDGGYIFFAQIKDRVFTNVRLNIGGLHNVENTIAAMTIADELGIEPEKIKAAVADFKGVKRRFEYIIAAQKKGAGEWTYPVFIDDYAHHPEELRALLKSVRSLFPQRKVTVLFQPHLFSRTRDFAAGFADALSIADEVVLLPIYPAREEPMPGVTSKLILDGIKTERKHLVEKNGVADWMRNHVRSLDKEFGEVIVTAGAGDIDTLVQPIKKIINEG